MYICSSQPVTRFLLLIYPHTWLVTFKSDQDNEPKNNSSVLRCNRTRLASPGTKCCFEKELGLGSLTVSTEQHICYFHDKSLDPADKILSELKKK